MSPYWRSTAQFAYEIKLYQRVNTIHGTAHSKLDCDTSLPFMAGLEDCTELPDMKEMGAFLNPLYQSDYRMIEAIV